MRTGRALLGVLLLAPLVGGAQTVTTTTALAIRVNGTQDTYTFTSSGCTETITAQWIYNPTFVVGTVCTPLRLWATAGDCGNTAGTGDLRFDDVAQAVFQVSRQGNITIRIADLPGFTTTDADGGTAACGADRTTRTHRVCGSLETSAVGFCGSGQTVTTASPLRLVYDTLPPGEPTITGVAELDGALRLSFTVDSDTATVYAEAKGPTDPDFVSFSGDQVAASVGTITVDGLRNGNTYSVRLRALDAAGNLSDPSDESAGTPVTTFGFFGQLRRNQSTEQGGCSAAGAVLVLGPVLLTSLLRRRRRDQ